MNLPTKPMRAMASIVVALSFAIALAAPQAARAQASECGELEPPYGLPGPWDYRVAQKKQLQTVESFHFTPDVESLRKGATAVYVGADIHYVLTVIPNHHRALMAMLNLGVKTKSARPPGAGFPIYCYFERAMRFQPDDATVRMLYGIYLLKSGDAKGGVREMEVAKEARPDDANLLYNLGLAYFDLADYPRSLDYAKQAYAQGFPLPGLRNKLKAAGKWKD